MPVHLYGRCADMDAITEVARKHGLVVIEDAAQAAGATYKGRPAGSFGDMACFSFYPAKNIGAIGEAGMVVTDNTSYADRIRVLRDHGSRQKYSHEVLGYNYRLEAIQAAALRVKLKRLTAWNKARQALAAEYRRLIPGPALLPKAQDGEESNHIFPILSPRRDELRRYLGDRGIETGIHYPIPAHQQPAFSRLGLSQMELPHTERVCRQVLSLPMHPHLSLEEVAQVAASIGKFSESAE
jgi:dTDP-4-amino-4,6-dideoxygalactose transaminase